MSESPDLDVLIFSRDGACRLDALLRSLGRHLDVAHRVHVLYRSTRADYERGYDALRAWHPDVRWHDDAGTFMFSTRTLLKEIATEGGRWLLPLLEEVVLTGKVDESLLRRLDEDTELLAVALSASSDNIPMSLAGHVYRTAELCRHIPRLRAAAGPRELAEWLAEHPLDGPERLFCPPEPLAANLDPGADPESLHKALLAGFRLDLDACGRLVADPRELPRPVDPVRDPWKPKRYADVETRRQDDLLGVWRQGREPSWLNSTAETIWSVCDGEHTRDELFEILRRGFDVPEPRLRRDLQATLEELVERELVEPARPDDFTDGTRTIDLREVPCFVINCDSDSDRRREIEDHLTELGLRFEFVPGVEVTPSWVGVALSHLKILRLSRAQVPFLVLEDDCRFNERFDPILELPVEADAYSLGLSVFGLREPGEFSWGVAGAVRAVPYTPRHLRVFNMLARHAVLYLTSEYCEKVIESQVEALAHRSCWHAGDIGCALQHMTSIVLAPNDPVCRQTGRNSTAMTVRAVPSPPLPSPPQKKPSEAPAAAETSLRVFREVVAELEECAVLRLGDRGFFAELTTVARAMIYCWVRGYRMLLDSKSFAYAARDGWTDYFESFCPTLEGVDPTTIRKNFRFGRQGGSTPDFIQLRGFQPEQIEIAGQTIHGFQEIMSLFVRMIFRFSAPCRAAVDELIAGLDLPERYVAVHLRRGDKVGDEDVHYETDRYLDQLGPLEEADAVFVMSDDYRAVEEVRERLAQRNPELRCLSLVEPSQSGFDVWKLRRGERFMAHQGGEELSDESYLFHETVRVLAEVSIAAGSRAFVSTWLSNVGRTVRYLHRDPERCRLLDDRRPRKRDPRPAAAAPADVPEMETQVSGDVEIRLVGDHVFHLELAPESPFLDQLLAVRPGVASPRADLPRLLEMPLDQGRAALTFAPRHLAGVDLTGTARSPLPPSHPLTPIPSPTRSRPTRERGAATRPSRDGIVNAARTGFPPLPGDGSGWERGSGGEGSGGGVHPGCHPRTNTDEGHLGGYIRALPSDPQLAHGDCATWSPDLWRWAVKTFEADSVLDVGCGEGHAAELFQSLGCRVRGIDGSRQAFAASRIPDDHRVHDYTAGPYVPEQAWDLVWSCEFVEHVEERFTHHFLATFAAARKAILMTFATPGQPGWHHVNCQPRRYWVDKVERLGFCLDDELTAEARRLADGGHFARKGLVFVRTASQPSDRRASGIAALTVRSAAEAPFPSVGSMPRPVPRRRSSLEPLSINDILIAREDGLDFYLFLDIFVHPNRRRIVAVAAFYGEDWDPADHGVDFEKVDLVLEGRRIRARYIPHQLASWEPCILFEFEDPALTRILRQRDEIGFTIEAGPHLKHFRLSTLPEPAWEVAMSLVVRDENRWIRHFLEYYLTCMKAQHVWVYDNGTADRDGLLAILGPYQKRGQVTYVPWNVRWRNVKPPRKMIGQPQQEAHSLSRFANSRWIGFLDVDELLRIPGETLPSFLSRYGHAAVDGLSFGLRWFLHREDSPFDDVSDPPLTFLHARPSKLGRKRQKFFVRPSEELRFLRLHYMEDGRSELQIDDTEIFFHHYVLRPQRFEEGKAQAASPEAIRDDFMLRFREQLMLDGLRRRPKNTEAWIRHIDAAFATAESCGSGLPPGVLEIRGMCGTYTRHFYNALCAFEGCRYLEIGSWLGASLCAVLAGNRVRAVAIENWSQFDGKREIFQQNLDRWRGGSEVRFLEQDCFEVDTDALGSFDVFLYDGDHRRVSHQRALEHFVGTLANPAVVIIDDWNWERVRLGTADALASLPVRELYRREILLPDQDVEDMPRHLGRDTWWNGICVLLLAPVDLF